MIEGTRKRYVLCFDGTTIGGHSPGTGGCAAKWWYEEQPGLKKCKETSISRQLGHVTTHAAKYCGLIIGLRELLRHCPSSIEFDLVIHGNSEQVINQLIGKDEVQLPIINVYHQVALGLLEGVKGNIKIVQIQFDENTIVDRLAQEVAAKKKRKDVDEAIAFRPSQMNLFDLILSGGQRLIAGTDIATVTTSRTPEIIFDATTVMQVYGEEALRNLKDPQSTTILRGETDMTILGIFQGSITCSLDFDPNGTKINLDFSDVIVVDFLPYDAQISFSHPAVKRALQQQTNNRFGWSTDYGYKFHPTSVSDLRFQSHPYWAADDNTNVVIFSRMDEYT